jgi:hypothetical protein
MEDEMQMITKWMTSNKEATSDNLVVNLNAIDGMLCSDATAVYQAISHGLEGRVERRDSTNSMC